MRFLIHHVLRSSVKRAPDKDAVVFKRDRLSYGELDLRSSQLARLLQRHGVGRGDRVAIYLNKGLESVIAVFGILKAGAAYVPLDPYSPPRRILYMLNDCQVAALITSERRLLQSGTPVAECGFLRLVVMAESEVSHVFPQDVTTATWKDVHDSPDSPFEEPSGVLEDDLAYILYTSGSTGDPKGVMISHRAALTFVNWACEYFELDDGQRCSNHAPLHFDLSTFDIFACLKAGSTVVIVPPELSAFPLQLAQFIEEEKISVWYSVPSALTRLVLHGGLGRYPFRELKKVLFAGEVFPPKYLRQLMTLLPRVRFFNLYGPTETNVCTVYEVPKPPAAGLADSLPIGGACANTEVFAVAEDRRIAGPGESGELYVRGPTLMKGYWGMPEKTRDVLVDAAGYLNLPYESKVYRTGDIVKRDKSGEYLFLGRRDGMVKSRGYRIELGEIEAVLNRHPAIEAAAVVSVPDEQAGNLIKAIIAISAASDLTVRAVQGFCAESLPRYMVPEIVEFRDSLPLTSSGKVDKVSLSR